MSCNRATTALKLVGIALCLAFFSQLVLTQMEHAGLFDCSSLSMVAGSQSDEAKNAPINKTCHYFCCHVPYCATNAEIEVAAPFHAWDAFAPADELAPDGLVKAIDHPPQLS